MDRYCSTSSPSFILGTAALVQAVGDNGFGLGGGCWGDSGVRAATGDRAGLHDAAGSDMGIAPGIGMGAVAAGTIQGAIGRGAGTTEGTAAGDSGRAAGTGSGRGPRAFALALISSSSPGKRFNCT